MTTLPRSSIAPREAESVLIVPFEFGHPGVQDAAPGESAES
jgi:hypothetical protein